MDTRGVDAEFWMVTMAGMATIVGAVRVGHVAVKFTGAADTVVHPSDTVAPTM
jgi:hypothetical protein